MAAISYIVPRGTFILSPPISLPSSSSTPTDLPSCRIHDLSSHTTPVSPPLSPYTRPLSTYLPPDGPDIVPRSIPSAPSFTPPTPYSHYSPAYPSSHTPRPLSNSGSSSALDSLRTLSSALDASRRTSSTARKDSSASSGSDTDVESASTSPGTWFAATRSRSGGGGYSYGYAASGAVTPAGSIPYAPAYGLGGRTAVERPLPPRSGGFSHRARSVDLVTPFSGAV